MKQNFNKAMMRMGMMNGMCRRKLCIAALAALGERM